MTKKIILFVFFLLNALFIAEAAQIVSAQVEHCQGGNTNLLIPGSTGDPLELEGKRAVILSTISDLSSAIVQSAKTKTAEGVASQASVLSSALAGGLGNKYTKEVGEDIVTFVTRASLGTTASQAARERLIEVIDNLLETVLGLDNSATVDEVVDVFVESFKSISPGITRASVLEAFSTSGEAISGIGLGSLPMEDITDEVEDQYPTEPAEFDENAVNAAMRAAANELEYTIDDAYFNPAIEETIANITSDIANDGGPNLEKMQGRMAVGIATAAINQEEVAIQSAIQTLITNEDEQATVLNILSSLKDFRVALLPAETISVLTDREESKTILSAIVELVGDIVPIGRDGHDIAEAIMAAVEDFLRFLAAGFSISPEQLGNFTTELVTNLQTLGVADLEADIRAEFNNAFSNGGEEMAQTALNLYDHFIPAPSGYTHSGGAFWTELFSRVVDFKESFTSQTWLYTDPTVIINLIKQEITNALLSISFEPAFLYADLYDAVDGEVETSLGGYTDGSVSEGTFENAILAAIEPIMNAAASGFVFPGGDTLNSVEGFDDGITSLQSSFSELMNPYVPTELAEVETFLTDQITSILYGVSYEPTIEEGTLLAQVTGAVDTALTNYINESISVETFISEVQTSIQSVMESVGSSFTLPKGGVTLDQTYNFAYELGVAQDSFATFMVDQAPTVITDIGDFLKTEITAALHGLSYEPTILYEDLYNAVNPEVTTALLGYTDASLSVETFIPEVEDDISQIMTAVGTNFGVDGTPEIGNMQNYFNVLMNPPGPVYIDTVKSFLKENMASVLDGLSVLPLTEEAVSSEVATAVDSGYEGPFYGAEGITFLEYSMLAAATTLGYQDHTSYAQRLEDVKGYVGNYVDPTMVRSAQIEQIKTQMSAYINNPLVEPIIEGAQLTALETLISTEVDTAFSGVPVDQAIATGEATETILEDTMLSVAQTAFGNPAITIPDIIASMKVIEAQADIILYDYLVSHITPILESRINEADGNTTAGSDGVSLELSTRTKTSDITAIIDDTFDALVQNVPVTVPETSAWSDLHHIIKDTLDRITEYDREEDPAALVTRIKDEMATGIADSPFFLGQSPPITSVEVASLIETNYTLGDTPTLGPDDIKSIQNIMLTVFDTLVPGTGAVAQAMIRAEADIFSFLFGEIIKKLKETFDTMVNGIQLDPDSPAITDAVGSAVDTFYANINNLYQVDGDFSLETSSVHSFLTDTEYKDLITDFIRMFVYSFPASECQESIQQAIVNAFSPLLDLGFTELDNEEEGFSTQYLKDTFIATLRGISDIISAVEGCELVQTIMTTEEEEEGVNPKDILAIPGYIREVKQPTIIDIIFEMDYPFSITEGTASYVDVSPQLLEGGGERMSVLAIGGLQYPFYVKILNIQASEEKLCLTIEPLESTVITNISDIVNVTSIKCETIIPITPTTQKPPGRTSPPTLDPGVINPNNRVITPATLVPGSGENGKKRVYKARFYSGIETSHCLKWRPKSK